MKTFEQSPRGMTAIELLVAMVLASLMLTAVMGVLGGLARQERALTQVALAPAWHARLITLMEWDLRNSRQFVATPAGVQLMGFAARDFATGEPTGRRALVKYYLLEAAGDRWLMRCEEHLDESTNDAWRAEIVCRGISRLEWGSIAVDQAIQSAGGPVRSAVTEFGMIPDRQSMQLVGTASPIPLLQRSFVVR